MRFLGYLPCLKLLVEREKGWNDAYLRVFFQDIVLYSKVEIGGILPAGV